MTDVPAELKRYLVIVKLSSPTEDRLMRVVPAVESALAKIAAAPVETAFISETGDTFGFFVKSGNSPPQFIERSVIPKRDWDDDTSPILDGSDSIFALELGASSRSEGFSRGQMRLQRR